MSAPAPAPSTATKQRYENVDVANKASSAAPQTDQQMDTFGGFDETAPIANDRGSRDNTSKPPFPPSQYVQATPSAELPQYAAAREVPQYAAVRDAAKVRVSGVLCTTLLSVRTCVAGGFS